MAKTGFIFLLLLVASFFELATATNTCTWGFYMCARNSQCISSRNRCDGTTQCTYGEDERNCPTRCYGYNFRCSNNNCVPRSNLCNGVNNCGDGSDESTDLCGGAGHSGIICYFCGGVGGVSTCHNPMTQQCDSGVRNCIKYKNVITSGGQEREIEAAVCDADGSLCSSSTQRYCRGMKNCKLQCCSTNFCNDLRKGYGSTESPKATKCYTCESSTSYKDCEDKSVLSTCNSAQSTCYKADYGTDSPNSPTTGPYGQTSGTRKYGKGCVSSSQCTKERLSFCRRYGVSMSNDCNVYCCTGDKCNTALSLGVSSVLLSACAVVLALLL